MYVEYRVESDGPLMICGMCGSVVAKTLVHIHGREHDFDRQWRDKVRRMNDELRGQLEACRKDGVTGG